MAGGWTIYFRRHSFVTYKNYYKKPFNFGGKPVRIQNTFDSPIGGLNILCLPLDIEYGIY